MPVDPLTAKFLELLHAAPGTPLWETPLAEARANMAAGAQFGVAPAAVASIADHRIETPSGPIAVRVYTPPTRQVDVPVGAVLQFHGGGYVLGSLDSHESIARHHCAHAGVVVVSVDYHLAPEYRFPTQLHDGYAALCWVAAQASALGIDPARIGVAGDSAGGNLAAALCAYGRAQGGPPIACQVLLYPVTDFRSHASYPSHVEFGTGEYFLSMDEMDWFRAQYLADVETQAADPLASLMAASDLSGLPPALVTTSGVDPLRDEGRAYADRLAAAGVPVTYRCFETTIHACASFAGVIPAGREMLDFAAAWLKVQLA
jgi:acetyl esterase